MEQVIVIIPVGYHNSRKVCEAIENQKFDSTHKLLELLIKEGINGSEVNILKMTDFMDSVNNQELDVLTDSFITYVQIKTII